MLAIMNVLIINWDANPYAAKFEPFRSVLQLPKSGRIC